MNTSKNLSKFVKIALLSAIAVVIMLFEIPLIPLFPWLKMDLSELPVLIGAFAFGPMSGVIIEGLKILLNLLMTGTSTGFVGELANFIIGVSFVVPAAMIYHRNKSRKSAIIGMIVGGLFMEVAGILANIYLLLPVFGMSGKIDMAQYVMVGLIPFNGLKAILVSAITMLVYKKLSVSIFKVDPGFDKSKELRKEN
ncbi:MULTISPECIES: ECF transporter S component [Clostridium]|uniref:ECF transporter S component n=1 Tax=Clostridium TaxID=1485 RepID=UPI00189D3463|nr:MULTISPECIES: ECF transporter S component [Clostridium]MDB2076051.1 ECF transporter S component [Clostridium paraputrificum]MDB2079491.1 ECF transporter S component [Clostridium paraputrificum]MDB2084416.1 ECF transporter S component [Clostridium paraputrificum]MDB2094245.1 ECF transporter S component [Clostridium paraputrificum]MDB2098841.1 ECF transporter S component [Clostridium paraputrificum]